MRFHDVHVAQGFALPTFPAANRRGSGAAFDGARPIDTHLVISLEHLLDEGDKVVAECGDLCGRRPL